MRFERVPLSVPLASSCATRLEAHARSLSIMQRLHQDDLMGHAVAHWLSEYIQELIVFLMGSTTISRFDVPGTRVDQDRAFEPAITRYYKGQLGRKQNATVSLVRVKPPSAISHLNTADDRLMLAGPDGTFEISEEDAKPLLAGGWVRVS